MLCRCKSLSLAQGCNQMEDLTQDGLVCAELYVVVAANRLYCQIQMFLERENTR